MKQKPLIAILLVGIGSLLTGLYLYSESTSGDRIGVQVWKGISLTHTKTLNFTQFDLRFITKENSQFLYLYYVIPSRYFDNDDPIMILNIPYKGNLTGETEGWNNVWLGDEKITLLYKEFGCTENNPCTTGDQANLYFYFDEQVDSKLYYIHSINIPFKHDNPIFWDIDIDVLTKRDHEDLVTSWQYIDSKPTVSVSIDGNATELNPVPLGHLDTFFNPIHKVRNTVFVWDISDRDITYHLDYTIPSERIKFENYRNFSLILFGTSIAMITTSVSILVNSYQKNTKPKYPANLYYRSPI